MPYEGKLKVCLHADLSKHGARQCKKNEVARSRSQSRTGRHTSFVNWQALHAWHSESCAQGARGHGESAWGLQGNSMFRIPCPAILASNLRRTYFWKTCFWNGPYISKAGGSGSLTFKFDISNNYPLSAPFTLKKWDWALLTHRNGRYCRYKDLVFRSKIEKCKQFSPAAGIGTSRISPVADTRRKSGSNKRLGIWFSLARYSSPVLRD